MARKPRTKQEQEVLTEVEPVEQTVETVEEKPIEPTSKKQVLLESDRLADIQVSIRKLFG